jgi:hypothetical protein
MIPVTIWIIATEGGNNYSKKTSYVMLLRKRKQILSCMKCTTISNRAS